MIASGIDLAGVQKRPSGFCVVDTDSMHATTRLLYTDIDLVKAVEESNPAVVAIDAPLSIPKGRRSLEERSPIHLRECDRELLKRGIKFFPVTLGPMRKLTARGISLMEELRRQGFRVIEVYPGGAQDILGIPRKQRGLSQLRLALERLGVKGLREGMSDHELDAVTSALVAKMYLEGNYTALGDPQEGLMIMPRGPPALHQP